MLTRPLPTTALEKRLAAWRRPIARTVLWVAPLLGLVAVVWGIGRLVSHYAPSLAPRHRAEALCFALAARPAFAPSMRVEPNAALLRGRFNPGTPPGMALRAAMQFDDRMVLSEHSQRVGDYDVTIAWLRLPGAETSHRWLVLGWMEGADLAVCSFRFMGETDELTPEEKRWGGRLLARVLVPENFRTGALPPFRLRGGPGTELPAFGPKTRS